MTGCYSLGLSHYSRWLHRRRRPAGAVLAIVVCALIVLIGAMIGGAV